MAEKVKVISNQIIADFQQEVEEFLAEIKETAEWWQVVYSNTAVQSAWRNPETAAELVTEYTAFIHYSDEEQERGCYPC